MTKTIYLFFPLLACITALQAQQTSHPFSISGKVSGIKQDTLLFKRYSPGNLVIDTIPVDKGTFVYHGQVDEPEFTSLTFMGDNNEFYFFSEKGNYTLDINSTNISQSVVNGSITNQAYYTYQQDNKPLLDQILSYTFNYLELEDKVTPGLSTQDTLAILNSKIDSLNEILFRKDEVYIQHNNQQFFSLYVLSQDIKNGMDAETAAKLFNNLHTPLQRSASGMNVKAVIDKSMQYAVGRSISPLLLSDANKQSRNIITTVKQNKYTLIDLWASWCVPCRQEFPFLKEAYARYHPQGFNIYAISMDMFRNTWVKALKELQLPWVNVISNNKLPVFYQVNAIPFNVLVNNKGVIVARELRGAKLDKKLQQLFQQ
ncbi:TlpA disulfide reductase family protein [Chitinophaga sancti]|uniref:TlpA disulfide reductase family protein n=1 Tax=Chitinophaga sancti TaxID=1004 RepID=UPI002A74DEFC|nr:TlpA disulfide reductase family protein [Chitinophaga sancti]WPQ62424.1 TlpA disulfide reductase family protein [Chitinophaga sancti]